MDDEPRGVGRTLTTRRDDWPKNDRPPTPETRRHSNTCRVINYLQLLTETRVDKTPKTSTMDYMTPPGMGALDAPLAGAAGVM